MKKLIPFAVLEKIQPLIEEHRDLITVVKDPNFSFFFRDADKDSDFYFRVHHRNSEGKHQIEYKPTNEKSVQAHGVSLEIDGVTDTFESWLSLLDAYAKLQTIYDDPILKSYEEEFASYFEMAGEGADKTYFNFEKQLLLEQYLNWVVLRLEQQREGITEEQKAELDEMLIDAQSLQVNLTRLSQNETVRRLAKLWAKARKFGLGLIKDLWTEFQKEGIKKLVEKTLKGELPEWDNISALIP